MTEPANVPRNLDELRRLNALLKTALALPVQEQAAWLQTLPDADQPLRARIAALLARVEAASDGFLRTPVRLPASYLAALGSKGDA